MVHPLIYALASVIVVSLASVIGAIPFLLHKQVSQRVQLFFLSLSVGALLGVVFLDFVPETIELGYNTLTAVFIILGVVAFYLIEKLVHYHHNQMHKKRISGHSHSYHLAPLNLIGDGMHNFLDGVVIGTSYIISPAVGFATTASVFFHEVPQELADMSVLIYSGLSKKKALFFNFLSAVVAILGALAAYFLSTRIESFTMYLIPFAAGTFIYIAAANLMPELHRHCGIGETFEHVLAMALGVTMIILVSLIGVRV